MCPGLNNVVRGLVIELLERYGVESVTGVTDGYRGLTAEGAKSARPLTVDVVHDIQNSGGTILGTSRGAQDPQEMVDTLVGLGINVLFVVGGDGSLRGAQGIADVAAERGVDLKAIAQIAGHTSIRTTAVYVESNPTRLARILQDVTW